MPLKDSQFNNVFEDVILRKKLEDLARAVNIQNSQLTTMSQSYRLLLNKHKRFLKEFKFNLSLDVEDLLKELHHIQKELELVTDVVEAQSQYSHFCLLLSRIHDQNSEEKALNTMQHVWNKITEIVHDSRAGTQQFCARLMVAGEQCQTARETFEQSVEEVVRHTKESIISTLVQEFQETRVEILRTVRNEIQQKYNREYKQRISEHENILKSYYCTEERLENLRGVQLNLLSKQRQLPTQQQYTMTNLDRVLVQQSNRIHLMSQRLKSRTNHFRLGKEAEEKNSEKLKKEVCGLQSTIARKQALLCRLHARAVTRQLTIPSLRTKSICN